ncbi:hypothetical protein HK405_011084 [Cladochytrium tenue]|nr:hypothetical protein HK405_011084 [Cladochytrium tenue]
MSADASSSFFSTATSTTSVPGSATFTTITSAAPSAVASAWGSAWTADFSPAQVMQLQIIQRTTAGAGLLAAIAMYAHYFATPRRRRSAANVLFLSASLADVLYNFVQLLGDLSLRGPIASQALCYAQGFLLTFSVNATSTWPLAIGVQCLLIVCFPSAVANRMDRFHYLYHVVNWSLPLVAATVSFNLDAIKGAGPAYDDNNLFCWISKSYKE